MLNQFDRALAESIEGLPPEQFDVLYAQMKRWWVTPDDRAWLESRIAAMRAYVAAKPRGGDSARAGTRT